MLIPRRYTLQFESYSNLIPKTFIDRCLSRCRCALLLKRILGRICRARNPTPTRDRRFGDHGFRREHGNHNYSLGAALIDGHRDRRRA